jgi:O-antigen ligase
MAVLLVGGTIYVISVLLKPTLGIYLLIIIIPFSSRLAVSVGGFRVGLMELVLAFSILAWLLKIMASRSLANASPAIKGGPLLWPFVMFIGAMSLSWLNTLSIGASLVETIKWLEMLLLYLLIVNLLPIGETKWVVLTLLVAGLVQAGLGLYQFVFKVGPPGFELFDGRFLRAYGTFDQPNPYGGYLGLLLPLALSLVIWSLSQPPKLHADESHHHPKAKDRSPADNSYRLLNLILLALSLFILLLALFASQSRGAWLGFAAAAIVTLVVRSRQSAAIIAVLAIVIALFGLISSFDLGPTRADNNEPNSAYSVITGRVANALSIMSINDVATTPVTDANFATIERLAHWQAAREMWRDHPWLGVGFGNYAVIYPAYAIGRWLDPLGHAHNYLLNLGAETGLIGITSYLIFWFFAFGLLWMAIRHSHGFYQAVAIGGLGILVHLHVHNLVDNLYVQGMYLHLAVILGLGSVIYFCGRTVRIPV